MPLEHLSADKECFVTLDRLIKEATSSSCSSEQHGGRKKTSALPGKMNKDGCGSNTSLSVVVEI